MSENKTSLAALKAIGCKEEGKLRSFLPSIDKNGRADIILISILKDEWFIKIKSELQLKLTKN